MKKFGSKPIFAAALWIASAVVSPAQTFTRLATFNGTNGFNPLYGSLVQGDDGNFYGTTSFGGSTFSDSSIGDGTIFEVSPNGKIVTLYSFCAQANCADGSVPYAGLVQGLDGNFYGTTFEGGVNNDGTVFAVTPAGQLSTLHSFCSQAECADGLDPVFALLQATNGNFYGTTSESVSGAVGTIFELTPTGQFTTLFSTPGPGPDGTLIQATNGNFYGVSGGGDYGKGCVFEISEGKLSRLFSFNEIDGQDPNTLVEGADGNLYGTTAGGGAHLSGTVFQLTPAGKLTKLYDFCTQTSCSDGANPKAALIQGTDGNLYGTTAFGGNPGGPFSGYGTVFQITLAGQLTTLYRFCLQTNCNDGSYPEAGLVQGTDGNFYGTTLGGTSCPGRCGTVFKLSMGLAAFVEASPNFGKIGRVIKILGNNLTGVTAVAFNGVSANFSVVSNTYIKAVVPATATTGMIEVTTSTGTLSSNVAFQIQQ
jgi:uncharacterized repeat protein (TIGR03803 family)